MPIINKHFWKICGGFLGIVAFSIGTLVIFEYWRDYKANEELKTLIKEAGQRDLYGPGGRLVGTSTSDAVK